MKIFAPAGHKKLSANPWKSREMLQFHRVFQSVACIFSHNKKIHNNILSTASRVTVIAVSKTFPLENIQPLIDYGHIHYGENRVAEAIEKWSKLLIKNKNLKIHLIGKLQTNKVKEAVKIFSYIHSLDSERLALRLD
jgi:uncharacterized pyridoxal phosphate-containing UPF0001 family protein